MLPRSHPPLAHISELDDTWLNLHFSPYNFQVASTFSEWAGGPQDYQKTHAIEAVDAFDKSYDDLKLAKICYSFTSANTGTTAGMTTGDKCETGNIKSLKCLFRSNFIGTPTWFRRRRCHRFASHMLCVSRTSWGCCQLKAAREARHVKTTAVQSEWYQLYTRLPYGRGETSLARRPCSVDLPACMCFMLYFRYPHSLRHRKHRRAQRMRSCIFRSLEDCGSWGWRASLRWVELQGTTDRTIYKVYIKNNKRKP